MADNSVRLFCDRWNNLQWSLADCPRPAGMPVCDRSQPPPELWFTALTVDKDRAGRLACTVTFYSAGAKPARIRSIDVFYSYFYYWDPGVDPPPDGDGDDGSGDDGDDDNSGDGGGGDDGGDDGGGFDGDGGDAGGDFDDDSGGEIGGDSGDDFGGDFGGDDSGDDSGGGSGVVCVKGAGGIEIYLTPAGLKDAHFKNCYSFVYFTVSDPAVMLGWGAYYDEVWPELDYEHEIDIGILQYFPDCADPQKIGGELACQIFRPCVYTIPSDGAAGGGTAP